MMRVLSSSPQGSGSSESSEPKHNFVAVTQLEDEQAIRSVEFHPSGKFYAVGSNTKGAQDMRLPELQRYQGGPGAERTYRIIQEAETS
ncbi:WD repeat-containing protein 47 [Caerostris extrusa]|uniref:WD repeat-containing protein 47 n=1 Tax=Caerostris extrusa TaxID=172846 RepID=A0AAV4WDZ8_CAEEX|nr:WD repeat-containing protein 47 [Caerostris extrusa]